MEGASSIDVASSGLGGATILSFALAAGTVAFGALILRGLVSIIKLLINKTRED